MECQVICFGNVRQNLAALDTFLKVMKLMNHIRLQNAKLAWYSLSVTGQIYLYGLEHDLKIYGFRPALLSKFLYPEQNFLNHLVAVLR